MRDSSLQFTVAHIVFQATPSNIYSSRYYLRDARPEKQLQFRDVIPLREADCTKIRSLDEVHGRFLVIS